MKDMKSMKEASKTNLVESICHIQIGFFMNFMLFVVIFVLLG
jgi:hypothetical protein